MRIDLDLGRGKSKILFGPEKKRGRNGWDAPFSLPRGLALHLAIEPQAFLAVVGQEQRADCGAVGDEEGGVAAGPEPAGPAGFTASSRFHMSNLHLSENSFRTFAG